MKVERTYKQLQDFDNMATGYLIRNGYFEVNKETGRGNDTEKLSTKLVTNIRNVVKQISKKFVEFNDKLEELRIDHCAVDEKTKVILREGNGEYKFTPEKLKALNKAIRALENEKTEIHSRLTEGEWPLSDNECEAFNGIVIAEVKLEDEKD